MHDVIIAGLVIFISKCLGLAVNTILGIICIWIMSSVVYKHGVRSLETLQHFLVSLIIIFIHIYSTRYLVSGDYTIGLLVLGTCCIIILWIW